MGNDFEYIIVGKLGSPHGVHGWIKVQAYTTLVADIFQFHPWYLQKNPSSPWIKVEIEDHFAHQTQMRVKLPDISTPEQASFLTGSLIGVRRSQLPELKESEYYWSDLIGMTVINQQNHFLGKVISLMETGSNDVLIVKGEKEHAIPWLMGSVITRIDKDKGEIQVHWEIL